MTEGQAHLLLAGNYPLEEAKLTFRQKLTVFQKRGDLNRGMKKKVQHIILAFSPSDEITDERMKAITVEYMEAVGFADQPYLVYRHSDTKHPHLHIVTTHVKPDGKPMNTFRIGKYKSEPARKALEEKYGLVRAEDQGLQEAYLPDPIDAEALLYGKMPLKATLSRIVRFVVHQYQFSSLPELNAALKQFNVMAERGAEDSTMYRTKGLVYSVIDSKGQRQGRAIKASSIYSRPTLPKLEQLFLTKTKKKTDDQKLRLRRLIDDALAAAGGDRHQFTRRLLDQQVHAVFRENEEGRIYGVTFVDNKAKCVYNGSDLDKQYGAKAILERLSGGSANEILSNKVFVRKTLDKTDYPLGFETVLTSWVGQGLLIYGYPSTAGEAIYRMGYAGADPDTFTVAAKKMNHYFQVNGFTTARAAWLYERMQTEYRSNTDHEILRIPLDIIAAIIREMMQVTHPPNDSLDYHWRRSARTKKRRRRY